MLRRRTIAAGRETPAGELLARVLACVGPEWADRCRRGDWDGAAGEQPLREALIFLENIRRNLGLFVPARHPRYGISERGGDAILAYLRDEGDPGAWFFFADVSGFTALLTFLTERFGKEEAGDIMNLSILNRYCLDKMGLLLDHFKDEALAGGDPGLAALRAMLAIRASMPLVTTQVRRELRRKLAGKPRQEEITSFIDRLEVKASGGVIHADQSRSDFYGHDVRARITWGETGKQVAWAEKVGGNDDPVRPGIEEVKGIGLDRAARDKLRELLASGWFGLTPADLALAEEPHGGVWKLVIAPGGMEKLEGQVEELCAAHARRLVPAVELPAARQGRLARLDELGAELLALEPFIGNRDLLLHVVGNLGRQGDRNLLLDESCSAVRDSGVLFCNFALEDKRLLDELADRVHEVMLRYGIHYKYNIFPKGDFNLMGVLGTMFSRSRGADKYYAEILWSAWRDLKDNLRRGFGGRVELRGGMSVGKGLQGPAGDNIIHNEETLIGPDCNLAARLVGEALELGPDGAFIQPPGTLFTIESQRRRVDHLIQPREAVRQVKLKGFTNPVALWSLVEREEVESVGEFIARMRRIPLVTAEGLVVRDEEGMRQDRLLADCLERIERAAARADGRAQLLAFVATSGVGKTRRVAELAHWALRRGWPVYFGECYSWYQGEAPAGEAAPEERPGQPEHHSDEGACPFHPFIRILKEQLFRIDNADAPELKQRKISQVLAALDPQNGSLADQAPVIGAFLGLELPETSFSRALDAEARRNIFYERTGDIFAREVERRGPGSAVLLCLDDLQWADRNSLHLLGFLLRRVGDGLVAIVNAREREQLGALLDPELPARCLVLEPGLLQTGAIEELARLVLGVQAGQGQAGELPRELRLKLEGELESNPFFVIEFCAKLQETEIITVADGRCTRFDAESFEQVSIPTRITGVIEDRIRRLPREEHAAIQFSSVLGNILRYVIIRQFLPRVDDEKLFEGEGLSEIFSRLTGQEITRLENEKDPDWVYTFKRALIGETLYQELVPSLRKRLHGEVAKIFEQTELSNRFEKFLLTALHYSNAEVPDKSCAFYLEAGQLAREVFDNERSLMLFDKIERILDNYRIEDAPRRRLALYENRGRVRLLLARYPEALEDFRRLEETALALEESEAAARARYLAGSAFLQRAGEGDFRRAVAEFALAAERTGDERQRALVLADSARAHLELGEREAALELLERAESAQALAVGAERQAEDRVLRATILRNRGSVFHRRGQFKEAVEIYRQALELVAEEGEDRFRKLRAMLCNSIGLSLMKAFRLEESMGWFQRALELSHAIGDLKTELQVRINMGVVANDSGRYQEALELLTRQLTLMEELVGESRELAALMFNIGESWMFMEKHEEAAPWYRKALAIGERIDYREFVVACRYNLGEVLHTLEREPEALEVLEPAFAMAGEGGWDLQRMDLANLLGEIHRRAGRLGAAAEYHGAALELGRRLEDDFGTSWALRNVAVDRLLDPACLPGERGECEALLAESLELARRAGQPENLMHSLRELIDCRLQGGTEPAASAALFRELRELAEKVDSRGFLDWCRTVAPRFER